MLITPSSILRLKKFHESVLDIIFPIHCIDCKKEGSWFCENCQAKIRLQDEYVCPICEKVITPDGQTCLSCKKKYSLNGLVIASSYTQSSIAKAVHLFKYRFIQDLHVSLGDLLVKVLRKTELPLPDLILPVPLHKRRLRWRGFNQSALLAEQISTKLLPGIILSTNNTTLIRNRYTSPQMKIKKYSERQKNISGSFSVSPDVNIKNKTILLVDDITTTGSTIFECARVLKLAGAKEVFAIVIARQETRSHKNM